MQQGIRFLRDLSPRTGYFDWRVWNTASAKPSERSLSVKRKRGSGGMLSAFGVCMLMNVTCGLCSLTSHSPPSTEGGSSDPQCSSLSPGIPSLSPPFFKHNTSSTSPCGIDIEHQSVQPASVMLISICVSHQMLPVTLQSGSGPLHMDKWTMKKCETFPGTLDHGRTPGFKAHTLP